MNKDYHTIITIITAVYRAGWAFWGIRYHPLKTKITVVRKTATFLLTDDNYYYNRTTSRSKLGTSKINVAF